MIDELDARVRALEAERARTRPRINLIDLAEMVDAITEDEEED